MSSAMGMYRLMTGIERARSQLREHELFKVVSDLPAVQSFMAHHVFAVWDFMSLVKYLQHRLTCVEAPWVPFGDARTRRFINEIVLGEESDDLADLGYLSHFELYRKAMQEAGTDCRAIDRFIEMIGEGADVAQALSAARAPGGAASFVRHTFAILETRKPHVVAAAFAFGREEPIPEMFRRLLSTLHGPLGAGLTSMRLYLSRHIEVDEGEHAPMAAEMLANLCGEDPVKWREAREAALSALAARLALWSAVVAEVSVTRAGAPQERAA
jgi:hypothetical protein